MRDPKLPTARVIDVDEYGECDVPITDVMTDGRLDVRDEITGQRYFDIRMKGDALRLTAGSAVGLIPLNDRVTIHVRPRVPLKHFAHLLAVAEGNATPLPFVSRLFETAPEAAQSVLDAMTRALLRAIGGIRQQGIHKIYARREGSTSMPRGRILFGPTVERHLSGGDETRLVAMYYERSTDTGPNRLLRYAVRVLAAQYRRLQGRRYRQIRSDLNEADHLFGDVPIDHLRTFLHDPVVVEPGTLPASRDQYVPAIRLAKAIVHRRGLDLPALEDVYLESLVFKMEDIFESYVRNVLRRAASGSRLPITVLGHEGGKLLFDVPPSERAEPDVVMNLRTSSGPALTAAIVEVKYINRPPTREHHEQLIAYGSSFRVPHAFLIHPAIASGPRGLYRTASIAPTEYHFYAMDLASPEMEAEERRLGEAVFAMILPRESAAA